MGSEVLKALRALPGAAIVLDALDRRADVWVVGGAVRDTLLGRVPRDLDLAVAGDAAALAAQLGPVVAEHERFGTVEVVVGGLRVGIASARRDGYPRPGALPDVERASLQEDLRRRDFTVNAIAASLDGELHGVDGWRADLDAGRIRVLHDDSFVDDPTRLWRAARYASRLGFALDPHTEQLARGAVADGALNTVTGSRIGNELMLALHEPDSAAALTAAAELGLLPAGADVRRGLLRDALALAPADSSDGVIALAAICSGVAPGLLRAWLEALAIPARERDLILDAVSGTDALAQALAAAARPSQVAGAARGRSLEAVAIAGAHGAPAQARAWLDELRHVRAAIDGHDLIAAGVQPGPELGERLARALDAHLDGVAVDRDEQLAAALA